MADSSRPQLVLNESSLNVVLQLTARKREEVLRAMKNLAGSLHEEPIGIETDISGRDLFVQVIEGWEITYWADWEKELRIVRIQPV